MTTPFHALRPELLEAIARLGYTEPTPIQAEALPPILAGRDVAGQAETGSGKTAAFGLGLLQTLDPEVLSVQTLVLCPTRELADQVCEALRQLAVALPNTRIVPVCGGRPKRAQRLALEQGAQVVVGTPGRIADHLRGGHLQLDDVRMLVLDEADRMLDMGFRDEVLALVEACPTDRQTLLFSATFPDGIQTLSDDVQRDPVAITVSEQVDAETLEQRVCLCEPSARADTLAGLLAQHRPTATLVFVETRVQGEALAQDLVARGASALALHGGLDQIERDDVLVQFANGSARVLVATDVAARGLDIPDLPAVIVAELSPTPEPHLHRIGRTGRAGAPGLAISLVAGGREQHRLERIEAFVGGPIPREPTPEPADDLSFLTAEMRTVRLFSGRKSKLRKGDLLGALVKEGGIPAEAIGRIDLADTTCAVAVRADWAERATNAVQRGRVKGKRVRAVLL